MMENFKFIVFTIITLAVVGVLGYWAIITIKPASIIVEKQKVADLTKENENLAKQITDLQNQINNLQNAQTPVVSNTTTPNTTSTSTSTTISSQYQNLASDLQKLSDQKVYMKQGSQGTRVGTVQTFLNLYNKTSNQVDNDYGASTRLAVLAFQKAVGIPTDGQTGPSTYQKMIAWLNK